MLFFDYKEDFSGVLYVASKGQCILERAYGYSEKSLKTKNFILTRFQIASASKIFTAISILKLAEKGLLNLDDDIASILTYLPEKFNGVTIRHLLTHTSGIGDYMEDGKDEDNTGLWKEIPVYSMKIPADFLPLIVDKKKEFEPGERFEYNNAGYILLGLAIEKLSEMSYIDFVKFNIFNPAGMSDSGYYMMNMLPTRTAYGYIKQQDGKFRNNIYEVPIIGGADGGAYVTAVDMGKFWTALMRHQLLSEEMTKEIFKIQTDTDKRNTAYGFGMWIEKNEDKKEKYFLTGYDPGTNFHMVYNISSDTLIIAISNEDKGAIEIYFAIEEVLEKEYSLS